MADHLPMSEADLQAAVLGLCKLLRLKVAHFRPATIRAGKAITPVAADGAGYPDLTITGAAGVMWRELKSATGRLRPEQRNWIGALRFTGQDAGVWRPADLHDGTIERELKALARMPTPGRLDRMRQRLKESK